jgi:uncharacterized membrane protein
MDLERVIRGIGTGVDVAGVAVTVIGAIIASIWFVRFLLAGVEDAYRSYRQWLGRAILLGLELLVAGDIIRTVAVTPSFASVGVLAVIVAIRTFLSFSLELEISGHWPWQRPGRGRDGRIVRS